MKKITMFICLLSLALPVYTHANPILVWIGEYLLGKAADGVWDAVSGAPDTRALDTRLKNLEMMLDGSLRLPIASLREKITASTTHAQYESYVSTALSSLERQVAKNTEDIQKLQERVTELESSQKGLQGELKRYLESEPKYPASIQHQPRTTQLQSPPPIQHLLRGDAVLNVHIDGRPTVVWSNGSVDVWADQNTRHYVLKPGQRLNFPNSATIHAVPRSGAGTTLFSLPSTR